MKASIDKAGRVVIPKSLREKAALRPGTKLAVRFEQGRIVLEPPAGQIRLERRGGTYVLVSDDRLPKMTTEEVEEIRRAIRRERGVED